MFSFEKITLKSSLSKNEILQRLADYIEPEKKIRFRFFWTPITKPYEGMISGDQFRVKRIINYRNSFLPEVNGNIEETVVGNMVTLEMRLSLFVRIFAGIWFTMLVIGIISIAIMESQGEITASFALIPMAALVVIASAMFLSYRYECKKARKDLQYLFRASEYIPH